MQDRKNINDPQKYRLGMVSKNILLERLNWFHGANLTFNSDVDQDIDFGLHDRPLTYQEDSFQNFDILLCWIHGMY